MQKMIVRIGLDVLLFFSVFLLPWWAVVMGAAFLFVVFQAPEVIVAGIILDALYRGSSFGIEFFFTLFFILLFLGARVLKRYIIVYDT